MLRFEIRIEEMRNIIPLKPFAMVPSTIYISGFSGELLMPSSEIAYVSEKRYRIGGSDLLPTTANTNKEVEAGKSQEFVFS